MKCVLRVTRKNSKGAKVVQIVDKSVDQQSVEMVLGYSELITFMDMIGIDTTGVTKLQFRVIKSNGRELYFPQAELIAGDKIAVKFDDLVLTTDEENKEIIDITFA